MTPNPLNLIHKTLEIMIMNTGQITSFQQPAYPNLPEHKKFSGCVNQGYTKYAYEPIDPEDPTKGIRVKVNVYSKFVKPGYLNGHTHIKKPASQLLLWLHGYKTLPSRACCARTEADIQIKMPKYVMESCLQASRRIYTNILNPDSKLPHSNTFLSYDDLIDQCFFLYDKIFLEKYLPELVKSPEFVVATNQNKEKVAYWDTSVSHVPTEKPV
ncbi:hypothetical protein [Endozoicomonas sp. GU-1]|uniref:hypothetical protein n=2 Tax=Endozoicomonas sp. GU-1 TaxID=3009078 RepID=UPI0022B4D0BC|nr:hypothetical protein [Endozoicomonas sp. GU-1]WBA80639.1 hypothetical protein O2T12_20295 [Endozoicomonas sp. GU-1]